MNTSRSHHPQSNQKLCLAERAAALKASAARMVRPRLAHQPSSETLPAGPAVEGDGGDFRALDRGPHDLSRGYLDASNRNPAATGDRPRQETDMGRHETFENAELLLTDHEGRRTDIPSVSLPVSARQKGRDGSSPESQPNIMDLAVACIDQVKRLADWDAEPDSLDEAEGDAEMDRWGALFQRAIGMPSASLRDFAGKAHLMLADLDRFYPVESYAGDNFRLMRVILAEAVAFGGLSNLPPDVPGLALADEDLSALAGGFDTAHSAWVAAARANDEPAERCNAHIEAAMARGVAPIPAHEQAWALPGVMAANDLEESTYSALAGIAMKALRMRPETLAGLALQARAVTP